jgi:hypothetical protein
MQKQRRAACRTSCFLRHGIGRYCCSADTFCNDIRRDGLIPWTAPRWLIVLPEMSYTRRERLPHLKPQSSSVTFSRLKQGEQQWYSALALGTDRKGTTPLLKTGQHIQLIPILVSGTHSTGITSPGTKDTSCTRWMRSRLMSQPYRQGISMMNSQSR